MSGSERQDRNIVCIEYVKSCMFLQFYCFSTNDYGGSTGSKAGGAEDCGGQLEAGDQSLTER